MSKRAGALRPDDPQRGTYPVGPFECPTMMMKSLGIQQNSEFSQNLVQKAGLRGNTETTEQLSVVSLKHYLIIHFVLLAEHDLLVLKMRATYYVTYFMLLNRKHFI